MNILLFGVSNIGKTTVGKILAGLLDYDFFDIDEEVKSELSTTLEEFVSTGSLYERDQFRCDILHSLLLINSNKVIAVTPLSYMENIIPLLSRDDVLAIELTDSTDNIFDRLVFSDENDVIYTDDEYKNAHAEHYLSEIAEDIKWYGSVYRVLQNHFEISGRSAEETALALIKKYRMKEV